MMGDYIFVYMVIVMITLLVGYILHFSNRQWRGMYDNALELLSKTEDQLSAERAEWRTERQQLLDRIQAQSFNEFKQAEIRMLKVEKGEPSKQTFPLE